MKSPAIEEVPRLASSQVIVTRKLIGMALAVPAIALLFGASVALLDLRFTFFSVALILGWTQLVGL